MLLHVMRHGPAEDRAPSGRDRDRPLSFEGRHVVERAASMLVARAGTASGSRVGRVVSSPLVRAVTTAEIVRARVCAPEVDLELRDELAAEDPPAFDLVRELSAGAADVLLVGHQPSAEVLVRHLCNGGRGLRAMRTATIATMRWDGRAWELEGVIDPHG